MNPLKSLDKKFDLCSNEVKQRNQIKCSTYEIYNNKKQTVFWNDIFVPYGRNVYTNYHKFCKVLGAFLIVLCCAWRWYLEQFLGNDSIKTVNQLHGHQKTLKTKYYLFLDGFIESIKIFAQKAFSLPSKEKL